MLPRCVIKIGEFAFYNCPTLHIHGYKDSVAEHYAKENNINFISIDDNESESLKLQEETDFENTSDLEQTN